MLRVDIFVTPEAGRREVNCVDGTVRPWNLQTQLKVHINHHGQVANEHEPVCRDITQKANGFVGEAVKYLQKVRQLMPLDPSVGKHVEIAILWP